MADTQLTTLQQRYDEATARCQAAGEAIRGLGFEPTGALLPGQPAPMLTEAQIAALAELRAADDAAIAAREELFAHLREQAGDAHR
ncbi:MAG: hypothetical protein QOJ92_3025 [Frankiales bacterium]|nr:hypothetical protein [Frankiales bacterium]